MVGSQYQILKYSRRPTNMTVVRENLSLRKLRKLWYVLDGMHLVN